MLGEQRFICGDNGRAASQEPRNESSRGLGAFERFNYHVIVAAKKRGSLRRQTRRLRALARPRHVADERLLHAEANACPRGGAAVSREACHGLADVTETEQADADGANCGWG